MSRPPRRRFSPEEDARLGLDLWECRNAVHANSRLADLYTAMMEVGAGSPLSTYLTAAKNVARRAKRSLPLDRRIVDQRFAILWRVRALNESGLPLNDNAAGAGAYTMVAKELHTSVGTVKRWYQESLFRSITSKGRRQARNKRAGSARQKVNMTR